MSASPLTGFGEVVGGDESPVVMPCDGRLWLVVGVSARVSIRPRRLRSGVGPAQLPVNAGTAVDGLFLRAGQTVVVENAAGFSPTTVCRWFYSILPQEG